MYFDSNQESFLNQPHSAITQIAPRIESYSNISQMLLFQAQAHAGLRYFSVSSNTFDFSPYSSLLNTAQKILGGLRGLGLQPQHKIILILNAAEDFLPAFWACILGGYVPCPLSIPRGDNEQKTQFLTNLATVLENPFLITTAELQSELPHVVGIDVQTIGLLRKSTANTTIFNAQRNDLAFLVLTSGSTGNTKAVMLTHGNLLASMIGKAKIQHLTDSDVTLNWVSFDHVAALIECHLFPLAVGACQLHIEPQFILDSPLRFLEIISNEKVTMTFTPNFLLAQINKALSQAENLQLDLSSLKQIICGGEAIVVSTALTFLNSFAPFGLRKNALWPAFGMTETCAGSIYSFNFPECDEGLEFASLGLAIDGMQMRIVDTRIKTSDASFPVRNVLTNEREEIILRTAGEIGELEIKGEMIFQGYFNNAAITKASFTPDGWFRTGDRGFIKDNRLTLTGRDKDSIIINGVNYYSHELETVINDIEGVEKSFVAAFPVRFRGADTEQLVILFASAIPTENEAELYQLMVAMRNRIIFLSGFRPSFIIPIAKAEFPKTSLGKILRPKLRQRFESGEFITQQEWVSKITEAQLGGYIAPENEIELKIVDIYADLFELDAATLSTTASFFELGGTSLDILRLKAEVDRRFERENVPILSFLQYQTPRELALHLQQDDNLPKVYDPLVPLQMTGTKTPLFCVHPGVGEVLVFVNLAKYFANERPFYALRARGFNEGETFFTRFEEMVDCYVKAIQRVQPKGPYLLAGYSYGGAVAFEMAKVFESLGERVDFVGIFNLPPHIKYRMKELNYTEGMLNLAFFLSLIKQEQIPELSAKLVNLPKQQQLDYIMDISPKKRLQELDLNVDKFGAWAELSQSLLKMGREYEPSGTVKSLSIFYAIPLMGTKQDWLNNQLKAWDNFARKPNRYIDVDGEHYTLMNTTHVSAFQAVLRKEIARAENTTQSV